MKLSLIRSMTRSAVFELENGLCYRPAHPFTVQLNGETVYTACETNVFSLFSLLPGTPYTVAVQAEGETLTLDFTTETETFFVDAARYGLVADGTTDNTGKLQAALSTCPKGGTVYVPAGRYRTSSLFMKSCTTLYLEKGAVLLGDNDRTHYPILPGVIPSENEVDEYYLTGWEGNPLDSFAGLLNITQVHDVVVTGEGTLDCDAQNGDWWINQKVKRIAWRPRAVAAVDSENICLHGITVQNSYSWTIHPIFVKHLDLLNFNINNPYNAPNTDGIDPESCEYIRIIGANIHVGDCFFIPAGTLHAICKGIVIAEVQQNSNVTYRVYDYGRVGADGKPRALHVEKALDVTLRTPPVKHDFGSHLAQGEYFTVDAKNGAFEDTADEKSFVSLLVTDGEGELICGGETVVVKKGDSFFLPAGSGSYAVRGTCQTLVTRV